MGRKGEPLRAHCPHCPHCRAWEEQLLTLWRSGLSQEDVGKRLGLTQSGVSRELRRLGATVSRAEQRRRAGR